MGRDRNSRWTTAREEDQIMADITLSRQRERPVSEVMRTNHLSYEQIKELEKKGKISIKNGKVRWNGKR